MEGLFVETALLLPLALAYLGYLALAGGGAFGALGPPSSGAGSALLVKRAVLVMLGIAALTIAAKIRVPFWPVPITMQTFVVLTVGAAYGTRLGVATLLGYLLIGGREIV